MDDNVVLFPGVHSIEAPQPAPVVDVAVEDRALTVGPLGNRMFQYVWLLRPNASFDDEERRDQLFKQIGEIGRAGGWTLAELKGYLSELRDAVDGWAEVLGATF